MIRSGKNTRRALMPKTRGDWLWLGTIVIVAVSLGMVLYSNHTSAQPDNSSRLVALTKADKDSMTDLVDRYLTTAGTFGLDWDSFEADKTVTLQEVHDQWLMNLTNEDQMDPAVSSKVTTRDSRLFNLRNATGGQPAILSPDSIYSGFKPADATVTSDAMWESGFKTDGSDIDVSFKGTRIAPNDDGSQSATLHVDWETTWTRATTIPGATPTQDSSLTGDYVDDVKKWNPATDRLEFKNVQITLHRDAGSKHWQIWSVKDGGDSTSIQDHGFALATSGAIKYDQNGKIVKSE